MSVRRAAAGLSVLIGVGRGRPCAAGLVYVVPSGTPPTAPGDGVPADARALDLSRELTYASLLRVDGRDPAPILDAGSGWLEDLGNAEGAVVLVETGGERPLTDQVDDATAAGAVLVLAYGAGGAERLDWVSDATIPVATLSRESALRVAELARHGATLAGSCRPPGRRRTLAWRRHAPWRTAPARAQSDAAWT